MNLPIPNLNQSLRKLISRGNDFLVFRLVVKAPALKEAGIADRLETWKSVPRNKAKRIIQNYVMETDCHGNRQMIPTWEDNYRLSMVDGRVFELISSTPVKYWR